MDQVFIHDLMVRGIIGINEEERTERQDIVINIILFTDTREAGQKDDINYCVNYRTVAKQVISHVENAARFTVEALAADVVEICLGNPLVRGARVKVDKPGAVRFSRSVGVEIERFAPTD